jgi:hypothetical protein
MRGLGPMSKRVDDAGAFVPPRPKRDPKPGPAISAQLALFVNLAPQAAPPPGGQGHSDPIGPLDKRKRYRGTGR